MMTYIVIGICLILLALVVYISAKPISDGIEARRNIKAEINEVEEKDNNHNLTSDRDIPEELKKIKDLYDDGVINEEEFKIAKKNIKLN